MNCVFFTSPLCTLQFPSVVSLNCYLSYLLSHPLPTLKLFLIQNSSPCTQISSFVVSKYLTRHFVPTLEQTTQQTGVGALPLVFSQGGPARRGANNVDSGAASTTFAQNQAEQVEFVEEQLLSGLNMPTTASTASAASAHLKVTLRPHSKSAIRQDFLAILAFILPTLLLIMKAISIVRTKL